MGIFLQIYLLSEKRNTCEVNISEMILIMCEAPTLNVKSNYSEFQDYG